MLDPALLPLAWVTRPRLLTEFQADHLLLRPPKLEYRPKAHTAGNTWRMYGGTGNRPKLPTFVLRMGPQHGRLWANG